MQITVKTFSRKVFTFRVEGSDTVHSLKLRIQEEEEIPLDQFSIAFAGKKLEDDRTLADYNIQDGSEIHQLVIHRFQ